MEVRKYLMLKEKYLPLVLEGKKRVTIRRFTRLKEGDLFYIHSGGKVWGIGKVLSIKKVKKDDIGEDIAEKEGMRLEELKRELNRYYGKKNIPLYVIEFEVLEVFKEPVEMERKFYGNMTPKEIAEEALEKGLFRNDPEAEDILRRVRETGSIRKVAFEMGGLKKRGKIRAVLRKAYELITKNRE